MSTCTSPPTAPEAVYRGRFAPSPTGPLHFGSLVTALAGYLQARAHHGQWLLRIDDIDPPRAQAGAADAIRTVLERCHLHWDREVFLQSAHEARHRAARDKLIAEGLAYRCRCSRKQVGPGAYPGTCRTAHWPAEGRHGVRVRVDDRWLRLEDPVQGSHAWRLDLDGGDFVIWRVEDLPAYHLAAVIDDADTGITEVVRGADLLESAPRQQHLQRLLGLPAVRYLHLPVAIAASGQKLSKQNLAPDIGRLDPALCLTEALAWLGQPVPAELEHEDCAIIIEWARAHWDPLRIPRCGERPAPALCS